jgi:hypothetical protein
LTPTLCGGENRAIVRCTCRPSDDSYSSIRRRGRQLNDAEVATAIWAVLSPYLIRQSSARRNRSVSYWISRAGS